MTTTTDAAIVVENLAKSWPDRRGGGTLHAVDDVSFHCRRGEVYGLLGPNGAGKTTTLRILATLLRPTAGSARVAGFDVGTQPNDVRRSIGYLSPDTRPYDRLSAREQTRLFAELHGLDPASARRETDALLERFDMIDFADTPVGRLSTGMKQKTVLIRTLVHDPPVLLLDEPTTGLDILVARRVTETIRDARERGRAVLLSTHIMREAEKLCDRVGILWRGRLRAEGEIETLRAQWGGDDLEDVFFRIIESLDDEAEVEAEREDEDEDEDEDDGAQLATDAAGAP